MIDPIAWIDLQTLTLPPLLRVALWAIASSALSMAIYATLSPQQKLHEAKSAQRVARQSLLRHDGDWASMQALIVKDLSLAFKQLWMVLVPFVVSVAPVALILYRLSELYGDKELVFFGPDWMHGFDFWYVAIAVIVSLIIKVAFKIA